MCRLMESVFDCNMHATEVRIFALVCFVCRNISLTPHCETELSRELDIYPDDRVN